MSGYCGDRLAEDGLSKQQDTGQEEEKSDETEGCAGCCHDFAPLELFQCAACMVWLPVACVMEAT